MHWQAPTITRNTTHQGNLTRMADMPDGDGKYTSERFAAIHANGDLVLYNGITGEKRASLKVGVGRLRVPLCAHAYRVLSCTRGC